MSYCSLGETVSQGHLQTALTLLGKWRRKRKSLMKYGFHCNIYVRLFQSLAISSVCLDMCRRVCFIHDLLSNISVCVCVCEASLDQFWSFSHPIIRVKTIGLKATVTPFIILDILKVFSLKHWTLDCNHFSHQSLVLTVTQLPPLGGDCICSTQVTKRKDRCSGTVWMKKIPYSLCRCAVKIIWKMLF